MRHVYAYRYRWVVLLSLVLLTIAVEIPWMNLAPLGRTVNAFYRDVWHFPWRFVDMMIIVYMAVFVLFATPAAWLISKCGVTISVSCAGLLIAGGSVLRVSCYQYPLLMIVGQVLYATAQVIALNLGVTTVARWFPIRERGMAMGIISSMQYIALGADMVLPGLITYDFLFNLFLGSFLCTVFGMVAAVLMREKPPTPSSLVEPAEEVAPFAGRKTAITKTRSLRGVMLIFAIGWGVLMAMLARIDFLADQLHMPSTSKFALALMLSGVVGAVVLPALSDYTRKRKLWYAACQSMALPGLLLMIWGESRMQVYFGAGIFGFFAFSAIPIGLQYGAELGYKYPEIKIQARMTLFSQVVGIFIMLVSMEGTVLEQRYNFSFFIGLLLACFFGSTFLDESPMIITEDERLDQEINKEIVQTE